MLARHDGSARLFILGLGAHVLAIGLLLGSVLGSTTEAEAPTPGAPAPAPSESFQGTARVSEELVPARAPEERGATRSALVPLTR